ncbi:spore coat protein U domain-containing protein [Sphingomonas sinipercae]|uniref:Spore coat protein U domain-containing protein n=1 Tax=Sphingomonas sinipercae TaxID=2714944 RepID=A0A6G7ZQL7_9SPHN|nr:spore coat U domain-containing protein [Sphingomonas sinipercae]QIL03196.1 spore coat protein U domain-containing protein [Sphingomonas sinipercae]
MISKKIRHGFVAICTAGLAFGSQTASAQSTTSTNLEISATVTPTCRVSATPVAFGTIDVTLNSSIPATGGMSVVCTNGTAWEVMASEGEGVDALDTDRRMTSTTTSDMLKYNLYLDSARTNVWLADFNGPNTIYTFSGVGTGSAQAKTVYAKIPAGQTAVPAGDYADTVVLTLLY